MKYELMLYSLVSVIVLITLTGGGAIEMELSKYLRGYARTVAGKEQLIITAFAKALEVIPRQLCDNAGFDSTNILNRLREKHSKGVYVYSSYCYLSTRRLRVWPTSLRPT